MYNDPEETHRKEQEPFIHANATFTSWLPYTLRTPWITALTSLSILLIPVIALLHWASVKYHGLAAEENAVLGWQFLPTLIAVLWTQFTLMLFDDLKRTEPFARLASDDAIHLPASKTLLAVPRPWWNILGNAFKVKNGRKRSWPLILACLVNVVAFLTISPLSSTLLAVENIKYDRDINVNGLRLPDKPLDIATDRETYFRITGSLFQEDVRTSPWMMDGYVVLPFWPSSLALETSPWDARSMSKRQMWQSDTLVFRNEFSCEKLDFTLDDVRLLDHKFGPMEHLMTMHAQSLGGCQFELDLHMDEEDWRTKFASWTDSNKVASKASYLGLWEPGINDNDIGTNMTKGRLLQSEQCPYNETILLRSDLANATLRKDPEKLPEANQSSSGYSMSGYACSSKHTMAQIAVNVSISGANFDVHFNPMDFSANEKVVPESIFNTTELHEIYTDPRIFSYIPSPTQIDCFMLGGCPNPLVTTFAGMSALLGSQYKYDWTKMSQDPDLPKVAAKVRNRIFEEVLRTSFEKSDTMDLDTPTGRGRMEIQERRVLVGKVVSFVLVALFSLSAVLLILVIRVSRIQRRPLNLKHDPSSVLGMASLVAQDVKFLNEMRQNSETSDLVSEHGKGQYFMSPGRLQVLHERPMDLPPKIISVKSKTLRRRTLLGLATFMTAQIIAIAVLYKQAGSTGLHRSAFTYNIKVEMLGRYGSFSPFAIVPTVVAIALALWWDVMDKTFRLLQPYQALTASPTRPSSGIAVSYRTSYWLWASSKAAFKKHWLLAIVTSGTFLAQVFIVAMANLFERGIGIVQNPVEIERTLELRHAPHVRLVPIWDPHHTIKINYTDLFFTPETPFGNPSIAGTLKEIYTDTTSNWLYSAVIESTMNATSPKWSLDDWNFIPVNVPQSQVPHTLQQSMLYNISLETPAIRATVKCTRIPEVDDIDTWLEKKNVTNWPFKPENATTAYIDTSYAFDKTDHAMPMRGGVYRETDHRKGLVSDTTISSWTSNFKHGPEKDAVYWPTNNFTVKMMHGRGAIGQWYERWEAYMAEVLWVEPPRMQALDCMPLIETSQARVVIDAQSEVVQKYEILSDIRLEDAAWSEAFVMRNLSAGLKEYPWGPQGRLSLGNVTTSYGHLFLRSLLNAAQLRYISEIPAAKVIGKLVSLLDDLDQYYSFRDVNAGLELDFMSYASWIRSGKRTSDLLDEETLRYHTEKTMSLFFQHFVSKGGWAYQSIGQTLPDVGFPFQDTTLLSTTPDGQRAVNVSDLPPQNTRRTGDTAMILENVDVLRMNPIATFLCVAILVWLLGTTVVIAFLQKKYIDLEQRIGNAQCIADVLALVAGSPRLLEQIRRRGVDRLRESDDMYCQLGWFKSESGEMRWGIEVVDGPEDRMEKYQPDSKGLMQYSVSETEGSEGSLDRNRDTGKWRWLRGGFGGSSAK
ncbi:hypothetical protein IQ07DRAFT_631254 [Pyrenochaeta sp. DS3sAY3a]|nr:hypothetical protein IQ07DRAFT_631254 [Pyrenochaeta sp. DS3sAY3a]